MKNKLEYSFDDELVSKFCYDIDNKRIEVYFMAYSDLIKNRYIEKDCIFTIENWKEARSRIGDEEKFYTLNKHIGIFSIILCMELKGSNLEMLVNTIDNRYITLIFTEPKISLI